MSDIALRVEGLGKRYRLGLKDSAGGGMYRYRALRDTLGDFAKRPLQTLRSTIVRRPMDESNSFWALSGVDFEVKRGEVVGIIGRNGAGKSTLLKILSRITKPTTGRVDLFGRVGSLLEVGTGFHPELTGRENIFLNGAILGMTRAEVRSKFDEIVAFSEIERFLDTPVKQYSSGMYTRLAFAVAAHLEPEILVVDEVLAVGDAAFQKKCLGKMKDVARHGRTVLFVSHQLSQVERLCDTGVLLEKGRVKSKGAVSQQIAKYVESGAEVARGDMVRDVLPDVQIVRCEVTPAVVRAGEPCELTVELKAKDATRLDDLCFLICDSIDTHVAAIDTRGFGVPLELAAGETVVLRSRLGAVALVEREYQVGVFVRSTSGFANAYLLTRLEVTAADRPQSVGVAYSAKDRGFANLEHRTIVATT